MRISFVLALAVLASGLLAGCGGGGSAQQPAANGGTGNSTVQGLTTPKSVSVVTAN